jgi:hypothetical protein
VVYDASGMRNLRPLRRLAPSAPVLALVAGEAAWADAAGAPTLSFWGKVILVVALIAVGVIAMRRSGSHPER